MKYSKIYHSFHKLYSRIPYNLFLKGYALPPLQVFFELTYDCNLRCKMCQFLPYISSYHKSEDKKQELSTKEVKSIITQIPRFSLISFTGGEPFLRKDLLDIMKFTATKNKFHVVTNGNMLTEELADNLVSLGCKNIFSKGLIMIGVSMEGSPKIHDKITGIKGSFQKTLQAIKFLNKTKAKHNKKYPLLNLAVVISKWNYDSISEIIYFADENRIDVLSFLSQNHAPLSDRDNVTISSLQNYKPDIPEIDMGILREQVSIIKSKTKKTKMQIKFSPPGVPITNIIDQYDGNFNIKHYNCYSFWSKIFITAKGDIFPCLPLKLGNLRNDSLRKIWNNQKAREFRGHIKDNGLFHSCAGCCMLEYTNNT